MSTRYYVFSKNSRTMRPLKNAATREEAREYKRSQNTPSLYKIFDRELGETVR